MDKEDLIEILVNDLELALKKLTTFVYFDKLGLNIRAALAHVLKKSPNERKKYLRKIAKGVLSRKYSLERKIDLFILPKKVELNNPPDDRANFITNKTQLKPSVVTRASIFIEAGIDIHLIAVLWTIKYGHYLDAGLSDNCFGNRLILNEESEIPKGRQLYKKYESQFQRWWSKAIEATKDLLGKGDDATIVNLDFKDYYHRVELSFEKAENFIIKKSKSKRILKDPIHLVFKQIHYAYRKKLIEIKHTGIRANRKDVFNLPIGLLSSPVLGNFFLRDFDNHLQKTLNPIFYGRYVDDILIVMKDTVLDLEDLKDREYSSPELIKKYFDKYLDAVFRTSENPKETTYHISYETGEYENIIFQKEKLFVYQFDAKLSSGLLSKFEKEQRSRSSAFQFLSDDDDNLYQDLDEIIFENNFDNEEDAPGRFKIQEDKKFELSVYLAKMLRGTTLVGKEFKTDQVEKIKLHFQGHQLIKGYHHWEKLLTLFFIREEYDVFYDLIHKIQSEINQLNPSGKVIFEIETSQIQEALHSQLVYAYAMAVGLNPALSRRELSSKIHKTLFEDLEGTHRLFNSTGLIRKSYVSFPLVQFLKNDIFNFSEFPLYKFPSWKNFDKEFDITKICPYRVKFYEVVLFQTFKFLSSRYSNFKFRKNKYEDVNFDFQDILDNAWELFVSINEIHNSEEVKGSYFNQVREINDPILKTSYFKIPKSSKSNDKFRIGLVNRYVDSLEDEKSVEGYPIVNYNRLEEFNRIWDDIIKIPNCDLFIMSEIALPWRFIYNYVLNSANKQVAVNTGVEHIRVGDLAFNFTLTCLPINIHGDRDAIPIIRLKNHYSHVEEDWIFKKRLSVPLQNPVIYNRYHWRRVFFSEYNCFELANVYHRNLFYGKIDLMLSPIWNKDMHYYNSLIESTSRDLHLPILMCNTSQYGDSRFVLPTGHVTRDKLRVKGGNVRDHRSSVLVVDFDFKQLRYFQIHDPSNAADFNKKYKTDYKPLPPNYPFDEAKKRYKSGL